MISLSMMESNVGGVGVLNAMQGNYCQEMQEQEAIE